MTTMLFKITPTPPTRLALLPGEERKFSFTVESLAAPDASHDVILQALLVESAGESKEVDWLVAGPQPTLTMSGGKTATVQITAKPPNGMPPGERTLKLVIADKYRPNEVHVDSQPVTVEVTRGTDPDKKTWWEKHGRKVILALIGGLVLAGGGVVALKLKDCKSSGVGQRCDVETGGTCPDDLVCARDVKKCLFAGGAKCNRNDECASGECSAVCAVPLGDSCDPANQQIPCPINSHCDVAKQRCLGRVGRSCSVHEQCATRLCETNVCVEPEPLRACTQDGICGADQQCVDRATPSHVKLRRCAWVEGHTCQNRFECVSGFCTTGTCTLTACGPCPPRTRCNNNLQNPLCVSRISDPTDR
jgi:hypothetical protein